ncbi:hypothetical protein FPQ18DRAFT_139882 [Pyronema domesticum]|nr:hypothetical protein FPQ18DRAFT_139882 [Pyronema domesticum]
MSHIISSNVPITVCTYLHSTAPDPSRVVLVKSHFCFSESDTHNLKQSILRTGRPMHTSLYPFLSPPSLATRQQFNLPNAEKKDKCHSTSCEGKNECGLCKFHVQLNSADEVPCPPRQPMKREAISSGSLSWNHQQTKCNNSSLCVWKESACHSTYDTPIFLQGGSLVGQLHLSLPHHDAHKRCRRMAHSGARSLTVRMICFFSPHVVALHA